MSESPASYDQDTCNSFTGSPSLVWMHRCILHYVSTSGHGSLCYTSITHLLNYRVRKQNQQQGEKWEIYNNLKTTCYRMTNLSLKWWKRKSKALSKLMLLHYPCGAEETIKTRIPMSMRCSRNSAERDIYNIRCYKQSKCLLWMIY